MADSSVAITAGTGTNIDTRTMSGGDHRQVVCIGDETAATVAAVTADGLLINPVKSATPTITSPGSVTTTTAVVLASNTARKGATVFVESGATLYLALGTTASLTAYTVQIPILGYYEVPYGYTGALWGITVAGTAVVRVTEVT